MITAFVLLLGASTPLQADPTFTPEQKLYIQSEIDRRTQLNSLTDEQALILYDQCLARGAVAMSRTSAAESDIFRLAYAQCLPLRMDLVTGRSAERWDKFKALDDAKRASFPELTKKVRAQRQAFDAENGKSTVAPH